MPVYLRRVVDDELDELMPSLPSIGNIAPMAGSLCRIRVAWGQILKDNDTALPRYS